jgi:WD40 repeat protein
MESNPLHKRLAEAHKLRVKKKVLERSGTRLDGHNFAIRLLQTLEAHLADIERDFACFDDRSGSKDRLQRIPRSEFVAIMMKYISAGPRLGESSWLAEIPSSELTKKVAAVFDAVDAGSRDKVSFMELMNYVIDCTSYGEVGSVQEAVPEYCGSSGAVFLHLEDLTKAKYVPETNLVLLAGRSFGVADPKTLNAKNFPLYDAKGRFSCVYDADYVSHLRSYCVVGTAIAVEFISEVSGATVMRIPTRHTHTFCSYDRNTGVLLAASGSDVDTFVIVPHRLTDKKYNVGETLRHHKDRVTQMLVLENTGLLATGSADHSVAICDLRTNEVLTKFHGHTTAVHCLSYIPHMNLMVSGGFDTETKVWMLASSTMRAEAFTLRDSDFPHLGHVVGSCSVTRTPQIATLDGHGMVKLWDLRMFRCVQNVRLEKTIDGIFDSKQLHWHSIIYDEKSEEIVAFAQRRAQKLMKKVPVTAVGAKPSKPLAADPAQSQLLNMADESPIVAVAYNSVVQSILTCSERRVRLWDVFSGHLEALFERIVPVDTVASAACVSSTGKVFFIGTRSGRISCHQYSNGSELAVYSLSGPEITQMTYCTSAAAISVATVRGLRIYGEVIPCTALEAKWFAPGESDGKLSTFDPVLKSLCVVNRKNVVAFWDTKQEVFCEFTIHSCGSISVPSDITAALILSGFPAIAISTNLGGLLLYTILPHPTPHRRFAETILNGADVVSMEFYPPKKILFVGDDRGYIHAFPVSAALESIRSAAPSTSWSEMMSTVGRLGVPPPEVYSLVETFKVHAHVESIISVVWASGTNVLFSAGSDQRVLAWTLGLDFLGELDPLCEGAKFSVVQSSTKVNVILEAPPGENIMFALLPAPEKKVKSRARSSPTRDGSSSNFYTKGEDGVEEITAHQFAEDIHKIAVELEGFVPSEEQRTRSKRFASSILGLGSEQSPESHSYGKRVPSDSGTPLGSPNAAGVLTRSLLTPIPDLKNFQRKKHIVAQGGDASAGTAFYVTQNHPLPRNARADRDRLIQRLMEQEQAASRALVQFSTSEDDLISRKAAESIDRQRVLLAPSSQENRTKTCLFDSGAKPKKRKTSGRLENMHAFYRKLLPCELLQIRQDIARLRLAQRHGLSFDGLQRPASMGFEAVEISPLEQFDWNGDSLGGEPHRALDIISEIPEPVENQMVLVNNYERIDSTTLGIRSLKGVLAPDPTKISRTHHVELDKPLLFPQSFPQPVQSINLPDCRRLRRPPRAAAGQV